MSKSFKELVKSQLSDDYEFPPGISESSYETIPQLAKVGMYLTFCESGSSTSVAATDYFVDRNPKVNGKVELVTDVKYRSREVVIGYLAEKVADDLWEQLIETDLIVILQNKHENDYSDSDNGKPNLDTAMLKIPTYNIDICSITYTWNNKKYTEIPKSYQVNYDPISVGAAEDINLSDKAKKTIKYVIIIDPQWGRKGYLCKKVKRALKRLNKRED